MYRPFMNHRQLPLNRRHLKIGPRQLPRGDPLASEPLQIILSEELHRLRREISRRIDEECLVWDLAPCLLPETQAPPGALRRISIPSP